MKPFVFLCLLFVGCTLSWFYFHNISLYDSIAVQIKEAKPCNVTSNRTQYFVSLGGGNDPYFIDALPLVAMGWLQLGVHPMVCLIGSEEEFENLPLKPIVDLLRILDVTITFLNGNFTLKKATISQHCRIYAALSDSVPKDGVVITSDADLFSFHLEQHWQDDVTIYLYNSMCCGYVELLGERFVHYPMSTVALRKKDWLELLATKNVSYEDGFSIEADVLKYGKDLLNDAYLKATSLKGLHRHPLWFFDQRLTSYRIHRWKKGRNGTLKSGEWPFKKKRLDRDRWPKPKDLEKIVGSDYNDCHLPRPISSNWLRLKPLFKNILTEKHFKLAELYGDTMHRLSIAGSLGNQPKPFS